MSGSFNAYHVWLGIPPNEQPPNHYRLLGITIFEADLDVIDHAADRQMAHVRTFQSGRHGPLSQQILNELSVARLCLLTAEKKAIYDEQLRAKFGVAKVAAIPVGKVVSVVKPVAPPKAAAIPTAIPLGPAGVPVGKPRGGGANSSSRLAVGPAADPIALDFDPMANRSAPSIQLRPRRRYRRANRWHREIVMAFVAGMLLIGAMVVYRFLPVLRTWVKTWDFWERSDSSTSAPVEPISSPRGSSPPTAAPEPPMPTPSGPTS